MSCLQTQNLVGSLSHTNIMQEYIEGNFLTQEIQKLKAEMLC